MRRAQRSSAELRAGHDGGARLGLRPFEVGVRALDPHAVLLLARPLLERLGEPRRTAEEAK